MELKKLRNTFKNKLTNHLTKKGKKQTIEKNMINSLKQAQKMQKKKYLPHS